MPKISVCVPTYNGERYLEQTINSILDQSYNNFELIIVDDKSTDNTFKICTDFSKIDSRIKCFRNTNNLGLVGNWNKCIEYSEGEWIKFVFQDDLISTNCLETMLNAASTNNKFVICYREFLFDDEVEENTKEHYLIKPTLFDLFGSDTHISKTRIAGAIISTSENFFGEPTSTLLHRSLFNTYGFFNPHFVQLCDLEYWIRVSLNEGLTIVPDNLAQFRIHPRSTSSVNKAFNTFRAEELDYLLLSYQFAYNPIFKNLGLQNVFSKRKFEIAKKAFWLKNTASYRSKNDITDADLRNWLELVDKYPKLASSFYLMPIKLKHWFDSTLLYKIKSR